MQRKSLLLALVLLAACGDPATSQHAVPLGDSPARGPADAWVTIVEFGDYQCPFCGKAAPTVEQILQTWPGDVRLVYKHLPLSFHERARPAAIAAECAREQGKFWEMHALLYGDQKLADDDLKRDAGLAGLDVAKWEACLPTETPTQRIDADRDLGLDVGVSGTPAFYVNGWLIEGAQPFEEFRKVIERELSIARASGIAKGEYYAKAVLKE